MRVGCAPAAGKVKIRNRARDSYHWGPPPRDHVRIETEFVHHRFTATRTIITACIAGGPMLAAQPRPMTSTLSPAYVRRGVGARPPR